MERRNCYEVIVKMIEIIPSDREDLIKDLQWHYEDSIYKAPEETIQWVRVSDTLQKHIFKPIASWEFEVLSIFTTKSIDELKQMIHD